MSSGKLELKITEDSNGQRVRLQDMSLKESKSLVTLLEALTNIIEQSTDNKEIRLQVVDGSIAIAAGASDDVIAEIKNSFQDVLDRKSVNKELVHNWRRIQELIWANGLHYEASFYQSGQHFPIIDTIKESRTFKTKITRRKAEYELKFIDGRLIENGGKSPNMHIIDKAGNRYTIKCTEAEARKVNTLLYQPIKVSAWRKITSDRNYTFCDSYLNDLVFKDFKDFIKSEENDYDKFLNNLHYKIKAYIDNKDFGNLRKLLRLFNHTSVESSTLKTVLIITKSFRDNEEIKSNRLILKELLEKKKGKKLI
jgi:hypothetical protein